MFDFLLYFKDPRFWTLFLTALCATAALTPLVMRLARRVGAVDEGGYRRVFEGSMPLMGGLGVALPLLVFCGGASALGYGLFRDPGNFHYLQGFPNLWKNFILQLAGNRRELGILAIGGTCILALGVWDDTRGLRARGKFVGQIAVAVFVCVMGYGMDRISLPGVGELQLGFVFGSILTILWIVGLINAFNLIDGVDGLASGITLIASMALLILGLSSGGSAFMVFVSTVLAGSLLAFLFFNFHPAKIFLGDTGSMFLGFVMATITLMGTQKSNAAAIILAPMFALSLPIFETLISMLRRYVRGVPIFSGDKHHTHHRLLGKGYSQRQVVLLLYAVAFLLAASAILYREIPKNSGWIWLPPSLFLGTLAGIMWLAGYMRPSSVNRIFKRRSRNAILRALGQYVTLSLESSSANVSVDELMSLCRRELRLGFLEAWFEAGPTLIAASGRPTESENEPGQLDSVEKVRVTSRSGQALVIRYEFDHEPEENERRDVVACLADIFEKSDMRPPTAEIVHIERGGADAKGQEM